MKYAIYATVLATLLLLPTVTQAHEPSRNPGHGALFDLSLECISPADNEIRIRASATVRATLVQPVVESFQREGSFYEEQNGDDCKIIIVNPGGIKRVKWD